MKRLLLSIALVLFLVSPAFSADISMDVDIAVTVPCNKLPLVDATDGKTLEVAIAYNEAGMNVAWNFVTTAGVMTTTAVIPTTAGLHDWLESGTDEGMYKIEIPASGGTVNNDTEGTGWLSGTTTTCLPFSGPTIEFRAAVINNTMVDGATGPNTTVPDAAGTLATYDPPTNAEMEARTIPAANYFDPSADTVANVTTVATLTGHTAQTGDTYAALPTNFSDLSITVTAGLVSLAADQSGVTIGTCTTNTDMRGTDNAALAATALTNATWTDIIAGYLDAAISSRAPTNEYDTQMGYIPSDLGDVPTGSELDAQHGDGRWTTY